jgi:hypothetical protein
MLQLNYLFAQYGKKFVRELTDCVRREVGIDGVGYSDLKPASVRGQTVVRKVKHSRITSEGTKEHYTLPEIKKRSLKSRLNHTFQFRENAFVSDSNDYGLQVAVNPDSYPGGSVTYEDIVAYNDVNSPDVNPEINKPAPSIFPMGSDETAKALVESMETYRELGPELERVVEIQLGDGFNKEIDKIGPIHIQIGG